MRSKDLVTAFYCDDENSRQMPGKKDFVSMKRNVHMQKRLILCNLKRRCRLRKLQSLATKIRLICGDVTIC